uniref:receptor protein-tyrosine kinase n=1 Tax=Podarcis muralis TaxID=64176 RepID=A0A670IDU8_PODMU
ATVHAMKLLTTQYTGCSLSFFFLGSASPTISPNLPTVIVDKGDPVSLHCSGNSSVEWVGIRNESNIVVYTNGTLYIPKASYKEKKSYQCAYVNRTSEETASVSLCVKGNQTFLFYFIQVTEGEDVVLPCLIANPELASNFTLWTDSRNISSGFSFNAQEGIRMHSVNMSDKNFYKCRALVQGQWMDSAKIGLIVEASTLSVTIKTKDHVRLRGEPFNITCRISSRSYSYECVARTLPTLLPGLEREKYFTDHTLSIPAVRLEDTGEYTCLGTNSAGTTNSSATLQVIESGYVHLSTIQNRSQETNLHSSLNLHVLIEAYPRPHTQRWTYMNPSRSSQNFTLNMEMTSGNNRYNNTLKLNRMEEKNGGIYTFFADNGEANASITFNISVKSKCSIHHGSSNVMSMLRRNSRTFSLNQQAKIMHEIPFGRVTSKSTLKIDEMLDNVTYCCLAVNNMGNGSSFGPLVRYIASEPLSEFPKPILIACAGTMFFLLLCIIFLFYKYKQKPKYQVRWKIIEACEGNNYTFIDPTQLPYNEKWEFPRNNLQFGKTLGAGAFGKVVEATAFGLGKEDSVLKVAVKMLKSTAHTDEQEALMSELKIMSHLGHHDNIVNLLGACTHGGPVFVITEYCPYGDLLNFLRKKAECLIIQDLTFESSLDSMAADYKNMYLGKKYVRSDSGIGTQCLDSYLEMKPVTASGSMPPNGRSSVSGEDMDGHPLDLYDLLHFSNQVAQGMAFLASKNCIHRDLAARNVLVADGRVAKICDFGLARDIMNDANYVVKGNARLPVKWMAPESIFECVYTVQSDVWSYGILLWEIFSLGRSPYPGMKVNSKFYSLVKQGYHMGRPEFAPEDMYNIMTACWNMEPTQRPTFSQISTFLQKQLDTSKEQGYTNLPASTEEDSGCEPSSYCEDESCDTGESIQPLLNSNNYQFC